MPFVFKGIDYNQARRELEDYIRSLPESSRWKDFVETSTGSHVLDLLAGLSVYLRHSVGIARREAYVSSARLYNSLVAIASTLAYPVNRPNALVLELVVNPNESVAWNKEVPIGKIGGVPLVLENDESFNAGVPSTIRVAAGEWVEAEFPTTNDDFQRFYVNDLVDNFLLKVRDDHDNVIPVRKIVDTLDSSSLVEVTVPDGVLILSGDGYFARKLASGTIEVQYVRPKTANPSEEISLEIDASILSSSVYRSESRGDSVSKLAAVIPGFRSSRGRAVTREDHRFIIMSFSGNIVDGEVNSTSECCLFDLSYINRNDGATFSGDWSVYFSSKYPLLSSSEKENLRLFVKERAMLGASYQVVDPNMRMIDLHGTVYVSRSSERDISDIRDEINSIFKDYFTRLGETLYVGEINVILSRVEGVERVYITSPSNDIIAAWNDFFVVAPRLNIVYA